MRRTPRTYAEKAAAGVEYVYPELAAAGVDCYRIQPFDVDTGLFGDREAAKRFTRRCGDLILTHRTHSMWYADVEPDEIALVGMHGGLHPSEMFVPFAAADFGALVSV